MQVKTGLGRRVGAAASGAGSLPLGTSAPAPESCRRSLAPIARPVRSRAMREALMIAFLLIAASPAEQGGAGAEPGQHDAADRCEARLAAAVKGEISNFAVDDFHRAGRRIHVKGTMNVLQRPAVRPGEMTPTHILVLHYRFDCRLDGRRRPRVTVSPLDG